MASRALICGIGLTLIAGFILALELWWVSLTLCVASFALSFEVHRSFSSVVNKINQKRLNEARSKTRTIISEAAKAKDKDFEKYEEELFGMKDYRVSAREPRNVLRTCVQFFIISAFVFLGAVLVRAAIDYGLVSAKEYALPEIYMFLFGLFLFSIAGVNGYNLMRLENHEGID